MSMCWWPLSQVKPEIGELVLISYKNTTTFSEPRLATYIERHAGRFEFVEGYLGNYVSLIDPDIWCRIPPVPKIDFWTKIEAQFIEKRKP